jgi:predicted  nucleic acid-binding Zn-ribbon protein
MSEVVNCTECGHVYAFLARGVCADCLNAREREFHTVRDWLRVNPGATTEEAGEATGVPAARIIDWIAEGRLRSVAAPGDEALSERLEQEAQRKRLQQELGQALAEPAPQPTTPRRGFNTRRNANA